MDEEHGIMSEIWIWSWEVEPMGDDRAVDASNRPDLTGYEVEATDGRIGKVDETSFDDNASGCLVVDTGFWIFGKKRMIPAGVISRVDEDAKTVYLSLDKSTIKEAPDYDEKE